MTAAATKIKEKIAFAVAFAPVYVHLKVLVTWLRQSQFAINQESFLPLLRLRVSSPVNAPYRPDWNLHQGPFRVRAPPPVGGRVSHPQHQSPQVLWRHFRVRAQPPVGRCVSHPQHVTRTWRSTHQTERRPPWPRTQSYNSSPAKKQFFQIIFVSYIWIFWKQYNFYQKLNDKLNKNAFQ